MPEQKINIFHILDLLHIPEDSHADIIQKLTEALAYKVSSQIGYVLSDYNKKELNKIIQNDSPKEIESFIKGKIDTEKLSEIVVREREIVIKEFIQKYLSMLSPKQREDTIARIDKYLPQA